jgi:hypothetical protein
VRAYSLYLLKLLRRGLQHSSEGFESLYRFLCLLLTVLARSSQSEEQFHDFVILETLEAELHELLP